MNGLAVKLLATTLGAVALLVPGASPAASAPPDGFIGLAETWIYNEVRVLTSNISDAGTDGSIQIRIPTDVYHYRCNEYLDNAEDNFERDNLDRFTFGPTDWCDWKVREFWQLEVWKHGGSAWHVGTITFMEFHTFGYTNIVTCVGNRWLASGSDYAEIPCHPGF